jgi:hypothetical protein
MWLQRSFGVKKRPFILGGLLVVLILPFVLFWFSDGIRAVHYEIKQDISGVLVVEGTDWMDIHSFGDLTEFRYRPPNGTNEYVIGNSDFYGRNVGNSKQIIKCDDAYVVSAGDRLLGDKIYATRDLRTWVEFIFDQRAVRHALKPQSSYSSKLCPDEIFITDLKNKRAEWHPSVVTLN